MPLVYPIISGKFENKNEEIRSCFKRFTTEGEKSINFANPLG